jgi:hypothetical protein
MFSRRSWPKAILHEDRYLDMEQATFSQILTQLMREKTPDPSATASNPRREFDNQFWNLHLETNLRSGRRYPAGARASPQRASAKPPRPRFTLLTADLGPSDIIVAQKYFALLGTPLPNRLDERVIKESYRRAAHRYHPDVTGRAVSAQESIEFTEITEHYRGLRQILKRLETEKTESPIT